MKKFIKTTFVVTIFTVALLNISIGFTNKSDGSTQLIFKSGNEALAFSGGLGFAYEWTGTSVSYDFDILSGCLTTTTTIYDMRTCHNSQTLCTSHQTQTGQTTSVDCPEIEPGG